MSEPFAMIPERVLYAPVSDRAKVVYAALDRCVVGRGREASPTHELLAQRLGVSVDTVARGIRELRNAGLVDVRPLLVRGHKAGNVYLLPLRHVAEAKPAGQSQLVAADVRLCSIGRELPRELPKEHTLRDLFSNASLASVAAADAAHEFEVFWRTYPRRVAKARAAKVWPRAVKRAGSAQRIIDAASAFAAMHKAKGTKDDFIPHPTTWLNGEQWDDETAPVPRSRRVEDQQWPEKSGRVIL